MAWLGLCRLVFITAGTVSSRGEVLGGSKKARKTSFIMYLALTAGLILLGIWQNAAPRTLLFAGCWLVMAAWPLKKAFKTLQPGDIRLSVKAGVRSEEHTSELQSLMRISYAVFCLQKKKT